MTEGKRNLIQGLLQEYDIQSVDDIQEALKYLLSGTIRDMLYTTNAIESLNSCYRRLNKQRSVFPSSQALMKALYLGTFEIAKKFLGIMPIRN